MKIKEIQQILKFAKLNYGYNLIIIVSTVLFLLCFIFYYMNEIIGNFMKFAIILYGFKFLTHQNNSKLQWLNVAKHSNWMKIFEFIKLLKKKNFLLSDDWDQLPSVSLFWQSSTAWLILKPAKIGLKFNGKICSNW